MRAEDALIARKAQGRPPSRASARATLQSATDDVHQRMHAHPGYAALAAGVIKVDAYRRLLARSYGFYAPIEARIGRGAVRSRRLEADLTALGMHPCDIDTLPRCAALPLLASSAQELGAAYVLEGAALGGRVLAGALVNNVSGMTPPTAFLLGDGADGGQRWREFVDQLEADLSGTAERAAAAQGARATFETFETWMAGWDHLE